MKPLHAHVHVGILKKLLYFSPWLATLGSPKYFFNAIAIANTQRAKKTIDNVPNTIARISDVQHEF